MPGDELIQASAGKITAARTRLILDRPFLGALVLRLELQDADPVWCATTGTDAKKFYYNARYVNSLKGAELQFVLSHEALHCALSHFARRQHRIKHRWDLACDYAINPILLDEGLTPPPGVMIMEEYRDMSAEEIYPLLLDNDLSETMDQHLYDKPDNPDEGGDHSKDNPLNTQNVKPGDSGEMPPHNKTPNSKPGKDSQTSSDQEFNPQQQGPLKSPPPSLSPQEIENLQGKWQQRLAGATQQAKQAGKLSALLSRFISAETRPQLPWRQLLATHLSATARDDYSYARPNTRRGDPAIFPMLRSSQVNAVVAVDVSGSISDQELNECISEINAIKGQLRAKVTILATDDKISPGFPKVFEAWQDIQLAGPIKGGGGTDFTPVFDWMDAQDVPADVLVYFTDAQGRFPQHAPTFPVVWLIKGKAAVPWGERIQLN
jgi:predicted metal-dependent peptidase